MDIEIFAHKRCSHCESKSIKKVLSKYSEEMRIKQVKKILRGFGKEAGEVIVIVPCQISALKGL